MTVKRNEPCLCGSGKKYKKCCYLTNNINKKSSGTHALPPFVTCNECGGKAPKNTFEIMDTNGMVGIDLAIGAVCEDCNAPTFAISGEPNAVQDLMLVLKEEMGGSVGIDAFK